MRRDVYNSAVQLFNLDVELADVNFQPLACLRDCDFLLADVLHLGQKLINLSLELGLLFLTPADNDMERGVILKLHIFSNGFKALSGIMSILHG